MYLILRTGTADMLPVWLWLCLTAHAAAMIELSRGNILCLQQRKMVNDSERKC